MIMFVLIDSDWNIFTTFRSEWLQASICVWITMGVSCDFASNTHRTFFSEKECCWILYREVCLAVCRNLAPVQSRCCSSYDGANDPTNKKSGATLSQPDQHILLKIEGLWRSKT